MSAIIIIIFAGGFNFAVPMEGPGGVWAGCARIPALAAGVAAASIADQMPYLNTDHLKRRIRTPERSLRRSGYSLRD